MKEPRKRQKLVPKKKLTKQQMEAQWEKLARRKRRWVLQLLHRAASQHPEEVTKLQ